MYETVLVRRLRLSRDGASTKIRATNNGYVFSPFAQGRSDDKAIQPIVIDAYSILWVAKIPVYAHIQGEFNPCLMKVTSPGDERALNMGLEVNSPELILHRVR
eukprot:SAG11_NODE_2331_length_3508_cov_1.993838_1_plen_103_part_00